MKYLRVMVLLAFVPMVLALLALAASAVLLMRPLPPAPFAFGAAIIVLPQPMVCRGARLTWTTHTTISASADSPVTVGLYKTLWSVDKQQTIIPAKAADVNYFTWLEPMQMTRASSYVVPLLAPGRYELRYSGVALGMQPAAYRVPFTVSQSCG